MTACKHEHMVPVSRPPISKDPHPDWPTLWRCLDCADTGRWDPAERLIDDTAA